MQLVLYTQVRASIWGKVDLLTILHTVNCSCRDVFSGSSGRK